MTEYERQLYIKAQWIIDKGYSNQPIEVIVERLRQSK